MGQGPSVSPRHEVSPRFTSHPRGTQGPLKDYYRLASMVLHDFRDLLAQPLCWLCLITLGETFLQAPPEARGLQAFLGGKFNFLLLRGPLDVSVTYVRHVTLPICPQHGASLALA